MKKLFMMLFGIGMSMNLAWAQAVKEKIIDEGSSGPYKAVAVTEKDFEDFVIYRPSDIQAAVNDIGKMPIMVYANGGCMDSSINHERLLSEIASHGYVILAIGELQMVVNERKHESTDASMLIDAIDWITLKSKDQNSDYYQAVDLEKIASGGQSCGGAQVMATAKDERIKTNLMFNSGMGTMQMAGASKESLKTLHGPVVYIVGGEPDIATNNALVDYDNIDKVPVAFANLLEGGHMGTFPEKFGGSFAQMALDWLDWQFNGVDNSAIFLDAELAEYPGWTMKSKNF